VSDVRHLHRTSREIFGWPFVVGVLSVAGLLAALIGDGIWDAISWAALLPPIALCGYFIVRGRRRSR
jgi:hypothetical protein